MTNAMYDCALKATNGFSESIWSVDPIRRIPPFLISPPWFPGAVVPPLSELLSSPPPQPAAMLTSRSARTAAINVNRALIVLLSSGGWWCFALRVVPQCRFIDGQLPFVSIERGDHPERER